MLSPAGKLKNPYRDQFQRALLSVMNNLPEGSSRSSKKERRHFYEIAMGSLRETQGMIALLKLELIREDADKLGASLFCLCRSLRD